MIDTRGILILLFHLIPVLYGIAFFNYVILFATEGRILLRLARPLLAVAVGTNFVYLLVFTFYFEHIPMVNVFQVLGAMGFAVAATYIWVEARSGTPYTGPFLLFIVLCCQVANTFFPRFDWDVPEILREPLFSYHVVAAVLGYSGFVVAAVYGFLYLVLFRAIRRGRFGLFFHRLPSLDILDRMNYYASAIGFGFLTLSILIGLAWSAKAFDGVHLDAKVMTALVTWVVYGASLAMRRFSSWRGPRMAYSSMLGFAVILFSIFGVNFFLTKFHEFTS